MKAWSSRIENSFGNRHLTTVRSIECLIRREVRQSIRVRKVHPMAAAEAALPDLTSERNKGYESPLYSFNQKRIIY